MGLYVKKGIVRTYEEQVDFLSRCQVIDRNLLDNAITDIALLAGEIEDVESLTFTTEDIEDGGDTKVEVIKDEENENNFILMFYNINRPYIKSINVEEV